MALSLSSALEREPRPKPTTGWSGASDDQQLGALRKNVRLPQMLPRVRG